MKKKIYYAEFIDIYGHRQEVEIEAFDTGAAIKGVREKYHTFYRLCEIWEIK